jgi:hypothetical protein
LTKWSEPPPSGPPWLHSRFWPSSPWTRSAKPRQVGSSLDNDVERGYERPLIEDMMMTNIFPGLETTMLDMAALTRAAA